MPVARALSAAALFAAATAACAQVYVWKDELGSTRVSSLPPPWYAPDARPAGPDVVVTRGLAVIDDTSLSPEQRSRLAMRGARPQPAPRPAPSAPATPLPEAGPAPAGPRGETARLVHEAYEAEALHRRAAEQLAAARGQAEVEAAAAAVRQARERAERARRLADAAMRSDAQRELEDARRSAPRPY